jgi:hypothetical protein
MTISSLKKTNDSRNILQELFGEKSLVPYAIRTRLFLQIIRLKVDNNRCQEHVVVKIEMSS